MESPIVRRPFEKNRKARATTLGGTGGDWKTLSCGRTAAGIMAGVNGRQTNKYSTAAGTGDRHDDFTGDEILAGWLITVP